MSTQSETKSMIRWTAETLEPWRVLPASKEYLSLTGLPASGLWLLHFDPAAHTREAALAGRGLRAIGYDDVVPLCLDEHHGGIVVAVEEVVGGGIRFINSNVESFGESLLALAEYPVVAARSNEDDILAFISQKELQLSSIDPHALDDPNHWWSLLIEQMRSGQL